MYDVIMIVIIMVAALNYAGHIKVDTGLMILLMSIALYVSTKENQKTQKNKRTKNKVEPLDGSTVAFDKEAFVNLNKIVNELVKEDQVTIAGNLVVKGKTTFEDDMTLVDGKGLKFMNKAFAMFGVGAENRLDGNDGWIGYGTHGDSLNIVGIGKQRHIDFWGNLTSKENSTITAFKLVTDQLQGRAWGENKINILGGTTFCTGEQHRNDLVIVSNFHNRPTVIVNTNSAFKLADNKWSHMNWDGASHFWTAHAREFTCSGTTTVKGDLNCSAGIRSEWIYTGVVDTDQLKGHAWGAKGHIYIPDHLVLRRGDAEISLWHDKITLKGEKGVEIPKGALHLSERRAVHWNRILIHNRDGYMATIYENANGVIKLHPNSNSWW
jgi:hypothetical protein